MTKQSGFLSSVEQYAWHRMKTSPLSWSWIGVGIVIIAIVTSALTTKEATISARNKTELVKIAAEAGDYKTAELFFDEEMESLRDLVYPARKLESRIVELKATTELYPESTRIFLELANLYDQIGENDLRDLYREKARVLNPND